MIYLIITILKSWLLSKLHPYHWVAGWNKSRVAVLIADLKNDLENNNMKKFHICIFKHTSESVDKGKIMRFKTDEAAFDFAKSLSLFTGKKIRVARENKNGNGIYFFNGENH